MKKITSKVFSLLLVLALVLPVFPANIFAASGKTTKDHNKQVIGYITQWDAWKDAKAGVPAQGAYTQLNVDFSKYTILNYSFFGVANDGSLHSGDFRNKSIYQPGSTQAPAPMLYTDVYSSWDLFILYGELDALYSVNPETAVKARAQGFEIADWGNKWSNPSWGVYNQDLPLPLKKEGGAPGLLDLAKQNGVKVMASIGGWSMCKHYSEMAASPTMRANFIRDTKQLMKMGFDGIDLDWEYPGPFEGMNFTGKEADYANFVTLVKEIRAAIGPDKLITSCFSAAPARLANHNWAEINKYVDYYNMMTYDFNGGWSDKAGHNSPLYDYTGSEAPVFNWDSCMKYLKSQGVNMNKVNMGMGFYGRGVVTNGNADLNAPTVKKQMTVQPDGPISSASDLVNWPTDVYDGTPNYSYVKQVALKAGSGWTRHWDDQAKVPYLTKGNFFLSYDDEESIGYKAQYVKDNNLAGVIVWTVYGDLEFGGAVTNYGTKLKKWSDVKSPLIDKVNEVFANGVTPVQTVSSPSFSVAGGTYTSAQNVAISTSTADATIRYTLDGSIPTASSAVYSAPIAISKTTTLKAKAFKAGMNDSAATSATYTIEDVTPVGTVATPSFNLPTGTYTTAQNVAISTATAGATIRYTTNGTEPTATSAVYSAPIAVSKTTTIIAKAFKAGMNDSVSAAATYTIETIITPIETVVAPSFSVAAGTYATAQNVSISTSTAGATIRYTTNGTEPTATSAVYSSSIAISKTTTLKAKAFKAGMNDSAITTATYTIEISGGDTTVDTGKPNGAPATPQLAHNNWDGNASYTITFNIWWGNNATSYKLYENGVVVQSGSLVANSPNGQSKVFNIANKTNGSYAYKIDLTNSFGTTTSSVATVNVTKGGSVIVPIETVAAPSFSVSGGTYTSTQNVAISTSTAGATIRYTTNGTEPTSSSAIATGSIAISTTTTLKAKAFKAGMNDSATTSATYTIGTTPVQTVATPSFSVASGTYKTAQSVTISTSTAGATIRYTTDGTEPTSSSAVATGAITVSKTTTLKAKAFKAGMNDSGTASATYTIESGSGTIGKVWAPYVPYVKGDIVSYNGNNYECRQPHTSLPGWEPTNVPALWLPYAGTIVDPEDPEDPVDPVQTVAAPSFSVAGGTYATAQNVTISTSTAGATIRYTTNGTEPTASSLIYSAAVKVSSTTTLKAKAFKAGMNDSTTTSVTYKIDQGGPVAELPAHILTGYWQNFDNGATCLKISDVPTTYNLIAVAFADASTTPGKVTFTLDSTLSSRLGGYTKQQFINDIAAAKTRGQKVIISVGGELGSVRVSDATSATNFANSVYDLMVEYGFDGVDIDLENGVSAQYMGSALRQLSAKAGKSLIIAMAPQTLDMQNPQREYFKLALDIKDILTVCNMQYYNSGSMLGQDGGVYSQSTVDFLTALADIQLQNGLRPDQVGLGLPASPKGAGGGYVDPSVVNSALNTLAKGTPSGGRYVPVEKYPTIRGAMNWSINWDAANGYKFANTVAPCLASLGGGTTPEDPIDPIQTVATPAISATGTTTKVVSITCTTPGATIRYTTNGTEPTASSLVYSGAITVSSTTTFKAKAFKAGMNDSAVATGTITPSGTTPSKDFKIVGYYPSWEPDKTDRIQYDVLTHINYSFAIPTSDGKILALENPDLAKKIIADGHANGVKVMIAIGGWSYNGTPLENTFVQATNTDAKIASFTAAIMDVVNTYGFDGVDMDWEHPRTGAASATQYQKLMLSLRKELDKQNGLLSSAVLSGVSADGVVFYDSAAHSDAVLNAVDHLNVMAYDGGDGDRHSSYSFAVNCGNYWAKTRKMDPKKVVLGVPFYGRPSWESYDNILKANPNAYNTDVSMINGLQAYYNGIPTITAKTQWAKANAGGIMMWEVSQDTLDKSKSLLSTIGNASK